MLQRVMIIGGPGSGKSTLARKLGQVLDVPVVHMDPIYWLGGWIERDKGEVMDLARAAADGPTWIIEGNHSASMEYRAEQADTIVFLNMPRALRMRRILWRSLRYFGRTRPDMGPDCPERLDAAFLRFSWDYQNDGRVRALRFVETWRGRRAVHVLCSRAEVAAFLGYARRS